MFIEPSYVDEVVEIIKSDIPDETMKSQLMDYHTNDIADALEKLEQEEWEKIYRVLGPRTTGKIFSYIENPTDYFMGINLETASHVISHMDSDDAVDLLEKIDDETREKLMAQMDPESIRDISLIRSFDDDER